MKTTIFCTSGILYDSIEVTCLINHMMPGNDIVFDGEQSREEIGKTPLYQFTAHNGFAKGATFCVERPLPGHIIDKLDKMIRLRLR